ncbi:uncharacterized protein [Magallana gigas]|uniref:uncharacterized protein n=1 Tax=Magallana gigas TaxID=29159 RepID=UPI00333FC15A
MVKRFIFLIIYCHFNLGRDVRGQRACVEDSNVLDSCDGSVISKNNLYVDFGVIKYQCSCSFNFAFNAGLFYSLSRNPGVDDCGTAIQIEEINGATFRMQCTSSVPGTVYSSEFTIVELSCVDSTKCDNAGYCLRILSNDASIVVNGSCQSKSSSEASITTAQSVPTRLIQSDQTSAMQKNSNQADITAFTLEKGSTDK